jgi:hypothetical protein
MLPPPTPLTVLLTIARHERVGADAHVFPSLFDSRRENGKVSPALWSKWTAAPEWNTRFSVQLQELAANLP